MSCDAIVRNADLELENELNYTSMGMYVQVPATALRVGKSNQRAEVYRDTAGGFTFRSQLRALTVG